MNRSQSLPDKSQILEVDSKINRSIAKDVVASFPANETSSLTSNQ